MKIKLFESYRNQYTRVIPRDFFNEAKLLKCMGFLALYILDEKVPFEMEIKESGEPFEIIRNDEHDMLIVQNYDVYIKGKVYEVGTLYNSKDNFPLYAIIDDEEIKVLDEKGNFTDEFTSKFI